MVRTPMVVYIDDVAVINAIGDLRREPLDKLEKAMMEVLDGGYRLVIIDSFEATKLDEVSIADFAVALKEAFSRDAEKWWVSILEARWREIEWHRPFSFI